MSKYFDFSNNKFSKQSLFLLLDLLFLKYVKLIMKSQALGSGSVYQ